jgi:hypothetical protein
MAGEAAGLEQGIDLAAKIDRPGRRRRERAFLREGCHRDEARSGQESGSRVHGKGGVNIEAGKIQNNEPSDTTPTRFKSRRP